jgi:nitronate monooxygenase
VAIHDSQEVMLLRTPLTDLLGISLPLVGAPMAGVGHGRLAQAVSAAGALGMIGVGSTTPADFVSTESAVASDGGRLPFGVGLMAWALPERPELFDAVLAARPRLVSVSFGDPAPYVDRLRDAGIVVASQVQDVASARVAVEAGIDLLVAQGTEAGGHTGRVGTLPLLQLVLDAVAAPVVAAGGIATPRGVAAALAAGACGVWVGTALIAAPESAHSDAARARIIAADETQTVHTYAFDRTLGIPWPPDFPGRALSNEFTRRWHGHEEALDADARQALSSARNADDYDVAYIYAGQAVGAVREVRPAGDVVRDLCDGAERLLRQRAADLL